MEIKGILTAKEMDNQGKKIPICNKCGNIKTCESVGLFSAPPNHTLLTYSCDCKKNRNDYYNSWENIIVRNDSITKEESRKIIADYFKSWDSISEEQAREIRLGDLTQKRNKLNRQITILKKAQLKEGSYRPSPEEEKELLHDKDVFFDGFFRGKKQQAKETTLKKATLKAE